MKYLVSAAILAIGVILAAVAIGGIYSAVPGATGIVYIIDKITGSVQWCAASACEPAKPPTPRFDPSKPFTVEPQQTPDLSPPGKR